MTCLNKAIEINQETFYQDAKSFLTSIGILRLLNVSSSNQEPVNYSFHHNQIENECVKLHLYKQKKTSQLY